MENIKTVTKGFVGCFGAFGAVQVSMTQIEQELRIASLVVGIVVGVYTVWSIKRGKK